MLSRVRSRLFMKQFRSFNECLLSTSPLDRSLPNEAVTSSTVHLQGWVKAIRKMKNLIFFNVDDGKSPNFMQVVLPKEQIVEGLTYGSSVKIDGELVCSKNGNHEVHAKHVQVVGTCAVDENYPFAPRKTYTDDYVRQFLHLRTRTSSFSAVLRIRDAASRALHNFFHKESFFLVNTPILTSSDCEGAGEVFTVKPNSSKLLQQMATEGVTQEESFFNKKVYLSVSGQLQLEVAVRNLGNVYTFGPVFRAENSKSRLHLSEFYMVEAEMGFTESLDQVANVSERLLRSVAQFVLDECAADIACISKYQAQVNAEYPAKDMLPPVTPEVLANNLLPTNPYVTMTYNEAISTLEAKDEKWIKPPKMGESLTKEHELYLVKYAGSRPVFIVDWPSHLKSFYMKQHPSDPSKVLAMDLLAPVVGEVCGGSLREDDYDTLQRKLTDLNLHKDLDWYLEIRKFGNVPSGGFGLGFERLLQCILSIPNIKDTIPFPRWPHNCHM